jgi:hypothetical protein
MLYGRKKVRKNVKTEEKSEVREKESKLKK